MFSHLHDPTHVQTHEQVILDNLSDSNFVQITVDQALRYLNRLGITSVDIQDILDRNANGGESAEDQERSVKNRVNMVLLAESIEIPPTEIVRRHLSDHDFVQRTITQALGYLKDIGITESDIRGIFGRNPDYRLE